MRYASSWNAMPEFRLRQVVPGTPAFNANFLEGDILLKMNGKDITDVSTLSSDLMHTGGQLVTFDLLRGEEHRTIAVMLNP